MPDPLPSALPVRPLPWPSQDPPAPDRPLPWPSPAPAAPDRPLPWPGRDSAAGAPDGQEPAGRSDPRAAPPGAAGRRHAGLLAGPLAATSAAAVAGKPDFTLKDAAAIFVVGVVIIVATALIAGRRGGRAWGIAWGLRPRRFGSVQRAAELDVTAMQEESELFFRPDGPGRIDDDL